MKKIVLVCKRLADDIDVTLGLENIRNYAMQQDDLQQEVNIEILSPGRFDDAEDISNLILEKKPDMVGITTFIWSVQENILLSGLVKKHIPGALVILGGPQVSDVHWDILRLAPHVDGVLRGEGEVAFSQLLRFWLKNGRISDPAIKNLSYRGSDGQTVHNEELPYIKNMDEIPSRYKGMNADPSMIYGLETARGCYNKCGYCTLGLMGFRRHSLEYLLDEVKYLCEAGVKKLCIMDSSITYDHTRLKAIARLLSDYGIRYICCAKAEELNEEIIDVLLDSGAMKIEFGLQTINPKALEMMGRKMNLEVYKKNIDRMMEKCRGMDVEVNIDIICGLPGDNLQTFKESMDFVYSLKPHNISSFPLSLLPGTDYYLHREKFDIEFIPFISEMQYDKTRYNMHRYGLVLKNLTFSAEEMEKGRNICLFNGLVKQHGLNKMIYSILDAQKISFSQFYDHINKYLPVEFYTYLETRNDQESIYFIRHSLKKALLSYGNEYESTSDLIDKYINRK